jgi:2-keto-4-pentenoate hydratase/2-oxohepta-3-ene-1,7-dioic acid hydratase in catechol pathway
MDNKFCELLGVSLLYIVDMKIIRYQPPTGEIAYGILDGDLVYELIGEITDDFTVGELVGKMDSFQILAPCEPTKVICAAVNFPGTSHFEDSMSEPLFFIKPATSVIGMNAHVKNPFPDKRWWGEAELGVVIKKQMKNVSESEAKNFVLGVTIGNDVTVDNCDDRDHHLLRSKGANGFCPIGPWIETDFSPLSWKIEAVQNGKVIRRGNTSNQFWKWPKILSKLSEWITLEPMDVVLTGNPPAINPDKFINGPTEFIARIENLGELRTYFV